MSFSATVDYRYRLVAADLEGHTRRVIVTRVSYQGVENLQPLLHFEGIGKPMALDMTQRLTISQIARSTAVSDWVGLMLELRPTHREGLAWIEIMEPGGNRRIRDLNATPTRSQRIPTPPVYVDEFQPAVPAKRALLSSSWIDPDAIPQITMWPPIVLGLVLIFAIAIVYLLENYEGSWAWIEALLR